MATVSTSTSVRRAHKPKLTDALQRCFFCHKRVTVKNGFIEFYSDWGDGRLIYPATDLGAAPLAIFSHAACGPDCGYAISLTDCMKVGAPHSWLSHIREKSWCSEVYLRALVQAEVHVRTERQIAHQKRRRAAP